jgi:Family of unknown function (DUF5678)
VILPTKFDYNALLKADPAIYEKNKSQFFTEQQELAKQYPNEWIAYNNGKVTAHGR